MAVIFYIIYTLDNLCYFTVRDRRYFTIRDRVAIGWGLEILFTTFWYLRNFRNSNVFGTIFPRKSSIFNDIVCKAFFGSLIDIRKESQDGLPTT